MEAGVVEGNILTFTLAACCLHLSQGGEVGGFKLQEQRKWDKQMHRHKLKDPGKLIRVDSG